MSHDSQNRIALEKSSQHIVTAFTLTGLLFMLLPGTFLGVWNLISISDSRGAGSLSQAWLQAHGQAQLLGWIGSFILGIGFYSLTKTQSTLQFPVLAAWWSWILWTTGISLRWYAGVTSWHWRVLLPIAALFELGAFLIFVRSSRRGPRSGGPMETWLKIVLAGTIAFVVLLLANLAAAIYVALYSDAPAFPHVLDQQLVLLATWGVLVPTIWGFNARWLPIFAGLRRPKDNMLLSAYAFSVAGVASVLLPYLGVSAILLLIAAILAIDALHVWTRPLQPPKLLNIHPSFVSFLRITYVWLAASCILFVLAVTSDRAGGIWGASRHALTVGFIAGMVFVIAPRIVPAFCGMRILWSTRLMLWSLLLLHFGCALRVLAEPFAYELNMPAAWKVLPVSAVVELTAVALFAFNLGATLLQPPAHMRKLLSTQ